jgi:hypothetical protein
MLEHNVIKHGAVVYLEYMEEDTGATMYYLTQQLLLDS